MLKVESLRAVSECSGACLFNSFCLANLIPDCTFLLQIQMIPLYHTLGFKYIYSTYILHCCFVSQTMNYKGFLPPVCWHGSPHEH